MCKTCFSTNLIASLGARSSTSTSSTIAEMEASVLFPNKPIKNMETSMLLTSVLHINSPKSKPLHIYTYICTLFGSLFYKCIIRNTKTKITVIHKILFNTLQSQEMSLLKITSWKIQVSYTFLSLLALNLKKLWWMVVVQGRFTCKQLAEEFHVILSQCLQKLWARYFQKSQNTACGLKLCCKEKKITPLFTILLNVDY